MEHLLGRLECEHFFFRSTHYSTSCTCGVYASKHERARAIAAFKIFVSIAYNREGGTRRFVPVHVHAEEAFGEPEMNHREQSCVII